MSAALVSHPRSGVPAARVGALVLGLVGLVGLTGCGRSEFEDRTAVVRLGGAGQTYEVASCGLDGQTLFLVARAADGAVVQAVVGLEEDLETGVPASTGITVDADPGRTDTRSAAFGPEAWERRGETGTPPGRIAASRLRGSRIQVDGDVVPVDARDRAEPGAEAVAFTLDARCDDTDDAGG